VAEVIPAASAEQVEMMISSGSVAVGDPEEVSPGVQVFADTGADQLAFGMLSSSMERDTAWRRSRLSVSTFCPFTTKTRALDGPSAPGADRQVLVGLPSAATRQLPQPQPGGPTPLEETQVSRSTF